MFLDLTDLSLRGGERHERTCPIDVAPVVLGGVSYQVLVPEGATVTVDRVAGGFLVAVSMEARVHGPCARCLNEVVLGIHAEEQEFAPTAKDGWQETDLSTFIKDLVVDVSGLVREALVLAVPAQLVCAESCKGLCPQCGADLNAGECGCDREECDERWEKLKGLRLKDDAGS